MIHGKNDNPRFNRRDFLRTVGIAGTVAPFFSWEKASALAGTGPNLLLFTWPDGLEDGWFPTGTNNQNFSLGTRLAALEPHKQDIAVLTGIKSGIVSGIFAHDDGPATLWTGTKKATQAGQSNLPSIDQVIGTRVGSGTAFRTLHFGVQSSRQGVVGAGNAPYFFSGANQPLVSEDYPQRMYDTIFGTASGVDKDELRRVRARRGSVFDFVRDQLGRIKSGISAGDRERMDRHAEGIRGIETSLDALINLECNPSVARPTQTDTAVVNSDALFPTVADLQLDLLVQAFQCRLTRVATYQLSNTDSAVRLPGTDGPLHTVYHTMGHAERVKFNLWFMEFLAKVIAKFKSVDLGNGKTLLDETLIVFGTEMSIGNHGNDPVPFIVAGGGGGYFKLGRWFHFDGLPRHTKLLTSIVRAMGIGDIGTVGQYTESDSVGELPEVQG